MSVHVGTAWARGLARDEKNGLSWKAVAVAWVLGDHAGGEGRCSPLQTTIAQEARISERAVRDGLDELRRVGAVEDKRTRGASVFVLVPPDGETGTTRRTEPARHAGLDRHHTPARPAPRADRRRPSEENTQEVNLSEGSDVVARVERREEVHPPSLKGINGNGNGSPTQPPLLTPVKASPETQQLARRLWKILDGGFGGLTDPKPTRKRPTEYAVLRVLERHQPGPIIAEEAAREARRTLQQREDGRNVVGLFEHKLKVQLDKQAGVHRQVVKSFGEAAAS